MKSWFVYLLRCSDGTLYAGITNDLARRIDEHNSSNLRGAKYVRGRRPVKLLYSKRCASRSVALKEEVSLKKLTRKGKLLLAKRSSITQQAPSSSLPTKLFQVVNEGFRCSSCGADVLPTTCGAPRNHCPFCLFSKHVDLHVGDRANPCRGMMKPIGVVAKARKNYLLVSKCLRCGEIMRSKTIPERDIQPDNFDLIVELSSHPIRE